MVKAQSSRDHREPTADVVDAFHSGQAQEGLLGDVFSGTDVAEHLVGEVDQVRAMESPRVGKAGVTGHPHTTKQTTNKLRSGGV